jgi:ribonuclease Y
VLLQIAVVAVAAAALTAYVMAARGRRRLADRIDAARLEARARLRETELEATAKKRGAETAARQEALARTAELENELSARAAALIAREDEIARRVADIEDEAAAVEERAGELDARLAASREVGKEARRVRGELRGLRAERIDRLAERCGESAESVAAALGASWLEEARAEAAHAVRAVEQAAQDPAFTRRANRLLEIAVGRYENHFLTERSISNISLTGPVVELLVAADGRLLRELEEVANVQMKLSESGDAVRLEGLDGVGREIARRALSRLHKKPDQAAAAVADPRAWATRIKENLEREIVGLGKKAFAVLEIPKAHPEIVDLVGRLNYRTSYTQNQWLHAVEASFLASMIGDELGLDRKLLRRATLMHDIGKALTHKIDGSHAVIGADIARRLGEKEVVANAIGSHHADEPANSVYAYLVAGADAMSGARPGARREHTEGYSSRLRDLERIGASHRGVERCYAVHGGRELRVYVDQSRVSDLDAVELSQDIAAQVSDEMTFPGQIKVTVIRSSESVSVAS